MLSQSSTGMGYFFAASLEGLPACVVSSIKKVATSTSTRLRQRGQRGVRVLAVTPSRNEREVPQLGHGRKDAVAMAHLDHGQNC